VRMGMASGVESSADVTLNEAALRMMYTGPCQVAAKAMQECAAGAMILAAASTFTLAAEEQLSAELLALHMGSHCLDEGDRADPLYQLLPKPLVWRAAHFGPVRSVRTTSWGCLQAPWGDAAVCFMHAVGYSLLEATDKQLARASAAVYQGTAQELLYQAGGYMLESADGLLLVAFNRPARAARWALDAIAACMHADWPEELLMHEVGEVVGVSVPTPASQEPEPEHGQPQAGGNRKSTLARLQSLRVQQLVFRGLRLKCGIDYGPVRADIAPATARVTYRGRVMNRAARIASVAKSGQVVVSQGAWDAAGSEVAPPAVLGLPLADKEVHGNHLGSHKLRGIPEEMGLIHCYYPQALAQVGVVHGSCASNAQDIAALTHRESANISGRAIAAARGSHGSGAADLVPERTTAGGLGA